MKKLNPLPTTLFVLFVLNQPLAAQTVHQISGIAALPDKAISLSFSGGVADLFRRYCDLYLIEASTDLVNWVPFATHQTTNSIREAPVYLDTEAPNLPTRFYRTATNQLITPFPKLTGPYAVGRVSRLLTDPSRSGTDRYGIPGNCSFMVTVWYPAVATAGVRPNSYLDEQVTAPQAQIYNLGDTGPMLLANFHAHAVQGMPMVTNPTKFPIVIYSHGSIGQRNENTDKVEHLASHGYIVVGIDHAGVTASVFPDGTVVRRTAGADVSLGLFQDKVRDIQFVIEEVGRFNNDDPLFAGRMDQERIGIFGWSYGGAASAELCMIDSRCRAGFSLDGGAHPDMSAVNLNKPFMIVQGAELAGSPAARFGPTVRELFARLNRDACWFKLRDAYHGDFADIRSLIKDPVSRPATAGPRYAAILRTYLLSFFNKYLKDQDDHLLDGPLEGYPEIEGYSKK